MKKILQLKTLAVALCVSSLSFGQIADGNFEDGTGWTAASTNFGTPVCDLATCGNGGGPCVPNNGSFYAWFGGASAVETASVEQSVLIPSGTSASINLWVKIASAGAGLIDDRLEVSADGTILSTVTSHDSTAYTEYTMLSVDVSTLADGNNHTVRIEGFQTTATGVNILVDDVVLLVDGASVSLFEDVMEPKFKVYPNPATTSINLTFGEITGDALVSIVSVDGSIVSQELVSDVFNKNFTFNTQNMDSGVYLVEVTNNGTVTTKRIVVAK